MPDEVNPVAILDHARGVIAERFGVGIRSADSILCEVARRQRCGVEELAAAVVASCTSDTAVLPRSLYLNTAA
jgi:hypothetical protein